jgi:hypothetical protein
MMGKFFNITAIFAACMLITGVCAGDNAKYLVFQIGGSAAPDPGIKLEKTTEWVQTPGFGHGLEFHGKGCRAIVPNFPADKIGDSVTISLFFKVEEFAAPRGTQKWAGALFSSNYQWLGRVYSDQVVYGGLSNQKKALKGIFSNKKVNAKQWNHFAMVYDAKNGIYTTYLNGERCGVRSDEITPLSKISRFQLGGDPDGCWFHGTVADFRIYNKVFTPAEIKQLAKQTQKTFTAKANFPSMYTFVPDVFSGEPILPQSGIDETLISSEISVTAALGEYEPATFVLRGTQDFPQTTFVISDFKDGKGNTIAAKNADLKIVKCWYQGPAAWRNEAPGKAPAVMVPELLLNDDALVKVDEAKELNFLRYGKGKDARYVNVSDTATNNNFWQKTMTIAEHPVYDAKTLQPIDLKAARNQQFHLTFHIPEKSVPGDYTGTVCAQSSGREIARFEVKIKVLPFTLPEPKTNYDLDKTYFTSIYYNSNLIEDDRAGITHYYRNEAQLKAEFANLIAHGVMYPTCFQLNSPEKDPALAIMAMKRMLQLRKEAGFPNKPIHMISNPGINLTGLSTSPRDLNRLTRKAVFYLDLIESILGHRDVYFYGLDEAKGDKLKAGIPYFQAIAKSGAKTFNSGYRAETMPPGNFAIVGDVLDLLICCAESTPEEAAKWHSKGKLIWSYAYPQSSNENPLPFRRNFGYVIWKCNYDGVATFCYYMGFGHPWNDFDSTVQRDMNFVYPTADGVVDTVAFEGVREGFDDVRYVTLMRLEAREAMKSGNPARIAAAKEAEKFFASQNVYTVSPAAIRQGVIKHILILRQLAGK